MMTKIRKKFPLFLTNPRLAGFFATSLAVFIFSFLLFAFTYLVPAVETVKAEGAKVSPSGSTVILEVHIANNGMVFLQGARVLSVSGPIFTVATSWNKIQLKWTVQTNESYYGPRHFGTDFLDTKGNILSIADIHEGSIVTVNGMLEASYAEPTVKADVIRILH